MPVNDFYISNFLNVVGGKCDGGGQMPDGRQDGMLVDEAAKNVSKAQASSRVSPVMCRV